MRIQRLKIVLILLLVTTFALSACDAQAGFEGGNDNSSDNSLDDNDLEISDDSTNDNNINNNGFNNDDDIDEDEGEEYKIKGVVENVEGNTVTINGETFEIDPSLLPEGISLTDLIQVGDMIEIEYLVLADGTVIILKVEYEHAEENDDIDDDAEDEGEEYSIKGVVESVEGSMITINGETFEIDPSLLPEGVALEDFVQVGDMVEIEYLVMEDGSIVVLKIELEHEEDGGDGNDDDNYDDDSSNDNHDENDFSNNEDDTDDNNNDNHNDSNNLNEDDSANNS